MLSFLLPRPSSAGEDRRHTCVCNITHMLGSTNVSLVPRLVQKTGGRRWFSTGRALLTGGQGSNDLLVSWFP